MAVIGHGMNFVAQNIERNFETPCLTVDAAMNMVTIIVTGNTLALGFDVDVTAEVVIDAVKIEKALFQSGARSIMHGIPNEIISESSSESGTTGTIKWYTDGPIAASG